ncbi:MAG: hypothetical protein ACE5GV_05970 [Candidatus Scalindua sp.]
MKSFDKLIYDQLDGKTPKEKYDKLVNPQRAMRQIAYPRRGSDKESWAIEIIAEKAQEAIMFKDY